MQTRIFEAARRRRRVVVATIAEASLTIDGIYYVVDGFVKQKAYNAKVAGLPRRGPHLAGRGQRRAGPGGPARQGLPPLHGGRLP